MSQSRLSHLPRSISRWLGYRTPGHAPPQSPYVVYVWSFIGAFCGLATIQAIFERARYFVDRSVPPIIASYVRHHTAS
jgi:hypothetical protein